MEGGDKDVKTTQSGTAHEAYLGCMISEISTPNLPRILKAGGFSFVIVDCEHGAFDYSQIASIVAVANGIDLPAIIRVPEIRREGITKYLDMGADGLLVPMVNTAADAAEVVRYAKYAPVGRRGLSTQRAHTEYAPPPIADYMVQANRRTLVWVQIETQRAVCNVRDIAGTEGVDALLIGPNDLAVDYGCPGAYDTPAMQAGILTVIAAAREASKPSGIITGNSHLIHYYHDRGMTIFSCGSEISMILSGAKEMIKDFFE